MLCTTLPVPLSVNKWTKGNLRIEEEASYIRMVAFIFYPPITAASKRACLLSEHEPFMV